MTRTAPDLPPAGQPHKNATSLASKLGVSLSAISNWKRRYPDAPQNFIADDWREFMERNGVGNRPGSGRPANVSQQEAQRRKTTAEAKLAEIKIAKELRRLIDADEVETFIQYAASKTKSALYQMVAETAPKCAGLEAGEIRGIMRTAADVICTSMQTTVEDWQAEQEEARKAAEQAAENNQ